MITNLKPQELFEKYKEFKTEYDSRYGYMKEGSFTLYMFVEILKIEAIRDLTVALIGVQNVEESMRERKQEREVSDYDVSGYDIVRKMRTNMHD